MARVISERLASFATGLALAAIPGNIVVRAKHLVLDAVGCAFAARGQPFAERIAGAIARMAGEGPRGVLGARERLPARDAALVNGMLMHGLDYDDTHAAGVVHLTVGVFPAVLAAAAQERASGADLLLAYIVGMEAGARLAAVAQGGFHQAGFHPTGVIGAFAAALAAGRLRGLSCEQLVRAQGIAFSFASGNLQFIEDGSWTKRLHPGWAAGCGLTAAALAAADLPAPREAYEGRFGLYRTHLRGNFDLALATAGLGAMWEIDNVAVKPYPACHFVHSCIDAVVALRAEGIEPDRVRSIEACVPRGVVQAVCEPLAAKRRPQSDYDAKFSLPYAVASGLVRGRFGMAELAPEALAEPRVQALMDKIAYSVDPTLEFPRHYGAEVRITLDDGRVATHREAVNRGNPERPLSNADIEAKYFENCALTLDDATARRIRDAILNLEALENALELEDALRTPPPLHRRAKG
jgi:2-methylcitrate dehydratase PrpD